MRRIGTPGTITTAMAATALLALPAAAAARPADVNIVNSPVVQIDPAANSVQIAGQPLVQSVQVPFATTVKVVPANADVRTCVEVPLPADGVLMLQSVLVTDYFSPTVPIAYIKPFVKTGAATGQVIQQRILLTTSEPDPTANVRTGSMLLPLAIAGGGFSNASAGEVYDLYACINHVSGESAQANFIFTGTLVPQALAPAPAAAAKTAVKPAAQNGPELDYGGR